MLNTHCVGVSEVPSVCQPATEVVVGTPSCDVIHHQSPSCTSVVATSHRSVEREREKGERKREGEEGRREERERGGGDGKRERGERGKERGEGRGGKHDFIGRQGRGI